MSRLVLMVLTTAVLTGCAGQKVGAMRIGVPSSWTRTDDGKVAKFSEAGGATVLVGTSPLEVEEGSRGATPHVCADQMAMDRGITREADFTKVQLDGYPAYRVKQVKDGASRYVLVGCDGFTSWFVELTDPRGDAKLDSLRTTLEPSIHYAHAGAAE